MIWGTRPFLAGGSEPDLSQVPGGQFSHGVPGRSLFLAEKQGMRVKFASNSNRKTYNRLCQGCLASLSHKLKILQEG